MTKESGRLRIEISGIVQGVGFRPFIYRLARERGLGGFVFNHDRGVTVEVEGPCEVLVQFSSAITAEAPPAARIAALTAAEIQPLGAVEFQILESPSATGQKFVPVSPDLALCEDCRSEILDPANRRYFYPFTNCTNCGPRFTIVQDVPYDRPKTTMARFEMCAACLTEYDNPLDRRFHAQPNACPDCGPRLTLVDRAGNPLLPEAVSSRDLLQEAAHQLAQGHILALKGIGGFHLACDARNEQAVATLRARKVRQLKPFAVMFTTLEQAGEFVVLGPSARKALKSTEAPIVLVEKRKELAPSVAPSNRELGVLLPYTPLHELLLHLFGGPLVMTSGNRSDEPISTTNEGALSELGGIADCFLLHDRDIHTRCDDAVVRVEEESLFFYRRSRGFTPAMLPFQDEVVVPILAVGAELKNTFCLAKEKSAVLSHHIGDLENLATLEAFEAGVGHLERLFNIEPKLIAHDLHPEFLNTKWVKERFSAPEWEDRVIGVQHHHAHLAACLEENGHKGPVLGVVLDGTGFGTDGTIWGGELLLADRRDFARVAHLRPVRLPGGAAAIRHPWRAALAYLRDTFGDTKAREVAETLWGGSQTGAPSVSHIQIVSDLLRKELNTFPTTSCGRLFDAVSALAGVSFEAYYEGQPAIELERILAPEEKGAYPFAREQVDSVWQLDWRPAIVAIAEDLLAGVAAGVVSARFHAGLIAAFVDLTKSLSTVYQIDTVALSGGCFLNEVLRKRLRASLERQALRVLSHHQVPTNDGGIAFGQAVVANQIARGVESCVSQFR